MENSHSDKAGNKGYIIMTDEWFDEFLYQVDFLLLSQPRTQLRTEYRISNRVLNHYTGTHLRTYTGCHLLLHLLQTRPARAVGTTELGLGLLMDLCKYCTFVPMRFIDCRQ